jgi:hypothetical protein
MFVEASVLANDHKDAFGDSFLRDDAATLPDE